MTLSVEAAAGAEGYIEVDFLHGTASGSPVSRELLRAIAAGADPDRALNRLSDIVERLSSGVNLFPMSL